VHCRTLHILPPVFLLECCFVFAKLTLASDVIAAPAGEGGEEISRGADRNTGSVAGFAASEHSTDYLRRQQSE